MDLILELSGISLTAIIDLQRLVEMRSAENERTRRGRDRKEKRRQEKELLRLNDQ